MPALTIANNADSRVQSSPISGAGHSESRGERPVSPSAGPPVSPITPEISPATLLSGATGSSHGDVPPAQQQEPMFIARPPPVPISESENTDAIALRSAISILQIQREKSKRDIKNLENMKKAAVANSEAFTQALAAGTIESPQGDSFLPYPRDSNSVPSKNDSIVDNLESDEDEEDSSSKSKFGPFPGPQNIIRCPPINWSKYHVVGESLDKLHEEQRLRPSPGSVQRDPPPREPEHVVAAPYRPFTDKVKKRPRTKNFNAKRQQVSAQLPSYSFKGLTLDLVKDFPTSLHNLAKMDPKGPSQPSQAQAYTTSGNPADQTPSESRTADATSDLNTEKVSRRGPSSGSSDPTPSALGYGGSGEKDKPAGLPSDEQDGEQMAAPGEGEILKAQWDKTGTAEEAEIGGDLDRKKAEQAPLREEIQGQREKGVDIGGALGGRTGPAAVEGR
ncbi:MAG: hypothetical protein M1819_004926 [Sarea resinae]|nr:MAG: hypothetical protein M1819_004926 [Sarea resinae]